MLSRKRKLSSLTHSQDPDQSEKKTRKRLDPSTASFGELLRAQKAAEPEHEEEEDNATAPSPHVKTGRHGGPPAARSTEPSRAKKPSSSRHKATESSGDDSSSGEDSDVAPKLSKRAKKNAPEELSSKKRVSSFRKIVQAPRREGRDPRFDPRVVGEPTPRERELIEKNYSFVDELRESELRDLKKQVRKEKSHERRAELARQIMSMESQKKARERKKLEQRILDEHRRQEKELVREGKKPFYLKKSEQKSRLLVEQFKGMKKRQVDKAIERKRKKVAAKEKRELDHLVRRR